MASASNVFGCAELLEIILLHVPPRKLITCIRICKHWKAAIEGSIHLQRALFFKPAEGGFAEYDAERSRQISNRKPQYKMIDPDTGAIRTVVPRLNPLLPTSLSSLEIRDTVEVSFHGSDGYNIGMDLYVGCGITQYPGASQNPRKRIPLFCRLR